MKKSLTMLAQVVCVVIAVMVHSLDASAQYRPEIDVQEWPTGKVVLTTGDTIYGPLTYHRTQEVINVHNEDGTISAFSPVNVQYFVAQEQPSNRPYIFRTLMWNLGRDYTDFKKPTFFEQLNQGPLTLVMREKYVRRDVQYASRQGYYADPGLYPMGNNYIDQVDELYYVLLPDGDIVTLRNVRKDLHRLFGKKSKQVKKFVKKKKLDYSKPHELIAIVNYFNSL
ncbi:hypothetical protein DXT99_18510 [Pontibacter diazotrophicus]|uniref:Uncharacterized protein n=1 Tax=Pontibacter diazotrophicus TaxID=1400979 RepID=A0A3D8L8K0_9BACT|nr:hypothetical protein [Pontibacter diazotrophicus]RDV13751.1 hypothetical protein DXT99_18510 [Pontibacter diazotrophicus]